MVIDKLSALAIVGLLLSPLVMVRFCLLASVLAPALAATETLRQNEPFGRAVIVLLPIAACANASTPFLKGGPIWVLQPPQNCSPPFSIRNLNVKGVIPFPARQLLLYGVTAAGSN